jgi:hypothetical protein
MFVLMAHNHYGMRDKIATFSSRKQAEQYIQDAKVSEEIFEFKVRYEFHERSLLAGYVYAWVVEEKPVFHNPEFSQ